MSEKRINPSKSKEFIDLDDLTYDDLTLRFLRKKLDDFTISIFKKIIKENKEHRGLVKTHLENYTSKRKRYDAAFLTLEVQGFIEKREFGTATPYYITKRGLQLGTLLKYEENEKAKQIYE